jgi:tetratricopeptide (TPR) repeat protein
MKKLVLFFVSLFIFLSCGVEKNPPVAPPPDINKIIEEGWKKYNNGEFETAYALFDSAIVLNSYDPRGYFGKGWSATQILKLEDAISSFSFTLILYGQRFDNPYFKEIIPEDSILYWKIDSIKPSPGDTAKKDTFWHIKVKKKPLLLTTSISIKKGTKFFTPITKDVDDSTALLLKCAPNTQDALIDTMFINYYYYTFPSQTPNDTVLLSYAGLTSSYTGIESYKDAIIVGRTLMNTGQQISFPYPEITTTKMKAIVSYSAFKLGYMGLCVRILKEINPDFVPPNNPYDPDNWGVILEELKKYIGGV